MQRSTCVRRGGWSGVSQPTLSSCGFGARELQFGQFIPKTEGVPLSAQVTAGTETTEDRWGELPGAAKGKAVMAAISRNPARQATGKAVLMTQYRSTGWP